MIEEFVKRGNLRRFFSGLRSPFYVDLRGVLGVPDLFGFVVEKHLGAASKLSCDVTLGVATGGICSNSVGAVCASLC